MSILFMVGLVKVLTDTQSCCIVGIYCTIPSLQYISPSVRRLVFSSSLFSFVFLPLSVCLRLYLTEICLSDRARGNREPAASIYLHGCWYTSLLHKLTYTHIHPSFCLLLDYSHIFFCLFCFLLIVLSTLSQNKVRCFVKRLVEHNHIKLVRYTF